MIDIDISLLKMKIRSRGLTISEFAVMIEMNASTFYRKLKNDGKTFTVAEVEQIINLLKLSKKDANAIFFKQKLADTRVCCKEVPQ